MRRWLLLAIACLSGLGFGVVRKSQASETLFRNSIAPLLERRCLGCHNARESKGELSLQTPDDLFDDEFIIPGDAENSRLIQVISVEDGKAEMPKKADPLSQTEIASIRDWINQGAKWPSDFKLKAAEVTGNDWWSLQPIVRCLPPKVKVSDFAIQSPIDAFVATKLPAGVYPSPPADKRTLARRVYFDLIGLPPSPEEIDAFLASEDPMAYEKLVDRLLASEHYGERWARHWLDVVHYGDTHGFDKDKLRPNAWPYRDYVIRSFNEDTPYDRFVKEQIAGDVLYPDDSRLIAATGFIVAGPWDFIGHVEVSGDKIDGRVARNLDRDDMVVNTIQTFCSATVGCARCHNHKFDPITQEDYYRLQAVFAAIGRKDRPYEVDPAIAKKRKTLAVRESALEKRKQALADRIAGTTSSDLVAVDAQISELESRFVDQNQIQGSERSPRFGYHSQVAASQENVKWVQVDLGRDVAVDQVLLFGADEYGWADFGFPHRFKIEAASDAGFSDARTIADHTSDDYPRPGSTVSVFSSSANESNEANDGTVRYVRVTATKLWNRRQNGKPLSSDWIFALGELAVISEGEIVAAKAKVSSLDSIQAAPRWARANLTDGIYGKYSIEVLAKHFAAGNSKGADDRDDAALLLKMTPQRKARDAVRQLRSKRTALFETLVDATLVAESKSVAAELEEVEKQVVALPKLSFVYAAATQFEAEGNHKPTNGQPVDVFVLERGAIDKHLQKVDPGTLRLPTKPAGVFSLAADHSEGDRRAALAEWIVDRENPLTWRSIVNRMWQYHFGRGLVDSPSDFGRMGRAPSHPDLLDWLAIEFRDGGDWISKPGSLKQLHRLMVTSSVYRQAAMHAPESAAIDGGNQYLWQFSRRRLEAEAIRDSVLLVAGKLDKKMYGPAFRDFVLEQTSHSPQFMYAKYDPDDETTHRRSVYRFLPRSQPQPFMESLDCADPSQQVAKRDETVTPLSALALLNNQFMIRMSEHFATRLKRHSSKREAQIDYAFRLAVSRIPTEEERDALAEHADQHGLASMCRVMFNLNEFVFVD